MNIEKGTVCPICGQPLTQNDDIVVCPECGTPHHRACWKAQGRCGRPERHISHQPESPMPDHPPATSETSAETTPDAPEAAPKLQVCPYCRTDNDPDARFCHHCGHPLIPAQNTGVRIVLNPLDGITPDTLIDGVPAKDLADVIGPRPSYYLPVFRRIAEKKRPLPLNLAPLFFDIPWLFTRKMYIPAIGVTLLELALAAPTIWAVVVTFIAGEALHFDNSFWIMYHVCNVLQWVLRIALGLFGNALYKSHCVELAQKLRKKYPNDVDFRTAARKKGGTSRFFLILTGIFTVIYMLFTAWSGISL